ncbi:hypothetical protein G3I44_13540 [Halogeometricum borinquense]|uniref:Uncharacterized protein n=1 Tax=Halogeometricum borinquense TaxID=60847 RepID=A0A6C0UI70_9EURY|nr:hypothetical protein [Halogeometricum borinquense]QIB75216.1 hypothetical protein G3I44_13540 [Halogeometricum borinquense]
MSQTIRIEDELHEEIESLQEEIEEDMGFSPSKTDLANILISSGLTLCQEEEVMVHE